MAENLFEPHIDSEPSRQSAEWKFPASAASLHAIGLAINHRLGDVSEQVLSRRFQSPDGSGIQLNQEYKSPMQLVVVKIEPRLVVEVGDPVERITPHGRNYIFFGDTEDEPAEISRYELDAEGERRESSVSEGEAHQLLDMLTMMTELVSDEQPES